MKIKYHVDSVKIRVQTTDCCLEKYLAQNKSIEMTYLFQKIRIWYGIIHCFHCWFRFRFLLREFQWVRSALLTVLRRRNVFYTSNFEFNFFFYPTLSFLCLICWFRWKCLICWFRRYFPQFDWFLQLFKICL